MVWGNKGTWCIPGMKPLHECPLHSQEHHWFLGGVVQIEPPDGNQHKVIEEAMLSVQFIITMYYQETHTLLSTSYNMHISAVSIVQDGRPNVRYRTKCSIKWRRRCFNMCRLAHDVVCQNSGEFLLFAGCLIQIVNNKRNTLQSEVWITARVE